MQFNFNVKMWCCLAENGFSLDELVSELKKCYNEDGFGEIISFILRLVQENLVSKAVSGTSNSMCCDNHNYVLNGSYDRKVKTSLGVVSMNWRRVKCKNCKKDLVPLKEFIGLEKHQYKTNELEQVVINAVSANSYRRAVGSVSEQGFIDVSKSSGHRWLMKSDCDELDLSHISEIENIQVIPDGTGYKGIPENGKAKKGDLKAIIGVTQSGEVIPLGTWADTDWKSVKKDLKDKVTKFGKGSVLVSDGESGITKNFVDLVDDEQRCHWHIVRDLYHSMYKDGGLAKDSRPLQKKLGGLLAVELPSEDFQDVSENIKDEIEERMETAEGEIKRLIIYLEDQGFSQAANYLQNSLRGMFGYVRRWLKLGIVCPRASSIIERMMRELGRRIKKISYNWSSDGVSKMARIILKKFTNREKWDQYWKDKLRLDGNIRINISEVVL